MITTPRLLYAGDKAKAESLKGAGLAWWHFVLNSNPELNSVNRTEKLPDGSLLIADIYSIGGYVKTGTVRIVAQGDDEKRNFSGFLYKERNEIGELTGKINCIVTDKNGYVGIRKEVDLFSELEVWSNHAGENSLLSAQRFINGHEIIALSVDENVLYSWNHHGKLIYLTETKELVEYEGFQRKKITVRIAGSEQTFVIPHQTIGVISVGSSEDGNKFFIFARLPDGIEDRPLPLDLISSENFYTHYTTPSSCIISDKFVLIAEYSISLTDNVFTFWS